MDEKIVRSYQILYKNDGMTAEYFAQIPGDIKKVTKLAKDLAKRYDQVRIQEETITTRTIKVYA